jgi:hypothetical protein
MCFQFEYCMVLLCCVYIYIYIYKMLPTTPHPTLKIRALKVPSPCILSNIIKFI